VDTDTGTAIAWSEAGVIDWRVFAVSIVITYFITNGAFISNEYFDYESDRINVERVGGDKVGVTTTGGRGYWQRDFYQEGRF
jgi:4-hydroxybenzoate polyprenyltransferase